MNLNMLPPDAPSLILIRHGEIAGRYRGVCYGQSDVELSEAGRQQSRQLATRLAAWPVTCVVHSGLQRTRYLAERLGRQLALVPLDCPALRERDYGQWELQPWDQLHRRHGDDLVRVVSEPDTYRPGGGETTYHMRDRVLAAFHGLPSTGLTVAVTHGGPIAALLGTQRGLPVTDWLELIPSYGQGCCIRL